MRPEKSAAAPRENTPSFVVWTLGLGALTILAVGIVSLISASSSASWPPVQGVITGHRIESSRYQKKVSYDYALGVDYAYEVEHQRHTGHSFSHATATLPLPSYDSRAAAEAAYQSDPGFRNWQAGEQVTVYYDPQHPANSVLQKGADELAWALCLLGAALLTIAAWEKRKLRRRTAIS